MIHGTDDPLVPYRGGPMPRTKLGGAVLSVPDAIKFWATHNHCSLPSVSTELPDMDAADQTRVRRDDYTRCTDGAEVVLYTVEGGGHTLPGGTQYLPVKLIGQTSHDVDGSEVIWKFFAAHRQP
jgi:polyhydroxybutyrate depolymerase